MSNPSHRFAEINLEFVRKEAKSLLKMYRSGDAGAVARIRAVLPRAAAEIKLADIQYVLAREYGSASWGKLTQQAASQEDFPDYSNPGEHGSIPEGFSPWRWSVTYTVHPELHSPMKRGEEFRIVVSVLRKMESGDSFPGFADLYDRATEIANGRAEHLIPPGPGLTRHKRIVTHGWFRHGDTSLVRAFLTLGVRFVKDGEPRPQGESAPGREQLAIPGGMTPENYKVPGPDVDKPYHEVYSDRDARDPKVSDPKIFLFSYGEFVRTCDEVDYMPFVKRAEKLARFHFSSTGKLTKNRAWRQHRQSSTNSPGQMTKFMSVQALFISLSATITKLELRQD
jgi:hypothetical protein